MESPQLENGYLRIANEIYDAFCRTRISGVERQILDCILRKTYGWGKCEDAISLSQFVVMTGVKKPNIERAINGLLSKKIITVIKNDNDGINVYKFVKDFSKWAPLPKKITLSKMITTVIKNDNLPLSKMIPTKDTVTKETITKEKPQKNPVEKIKLLDSVYLSQEQIDNLKNKFKNGDFERAVEILNNYKMSSGRKYKSDYHTILGWVSKEVLKGKPTHNPWEGAI